MSTTKLLVKIGVHSVGSLANQPNPLWHTSLSMSKKLPTKLAKEPMVDAVFELRFSSKMPVSAILPGTLFSWLTGKGEKVTISNLPQASLPAVMRDTDPNLRYAPLVRIDWNGFAVHVGDRVVGVICKMPYAGWTAFKEVIVDVVQKTFDIGAIDAIERFAMKYTDLFQETDLEKAIAGFNLSVNIGEHALKAESAQIRVEINRDTFVHGVNIITQATAEDPARGTKKTGAVLEVDSVSTTRWTNMGAFLGQMPTSLENIHASNKRMFFECLKPQLIKDLGAQYD